MRLRSGGLTWREIDGHTVVLDLHSSTYFRTNRTGTFLLRKLVEDHQRDELIAHLAEEYGIGDEQATEDVNRFVKVLSERGLLAAETGES
jgi:hypothetical protein